MGACAEMLTHAEGEMAIRCAIDAKREGILEDLLVPIRRGVEERDELALLDLLTAKLDVLGRGARELDDRAGDV